MDPPAGLSWARAGVDVARLTGRLCRCGGGIPGIGISNMAAG
ncbi:hypothetical protein HMPREF0591_1338 [Mycobacterium parascrofulaceum ATCC BAA-614]|uniref:Uncharacterized protein n=1 Tax=Mycobacterium parascrofulaceum ATCC BAA-614 TaxID=525368 RepID=D5P594_9MYCO|nr:hypothetical protein HMPREF0591_1338 [Mycobacterium parascrofulaceum ATCC BAA-614]